MSSRRPQPAFDLAGVDRRGGAITVGLVVAALAGVVLAGRAATVDPSEARPLLGLLNLALALPFVLVAGGLVAMRGTLSLRFSLAAAATASSMALWITAEALDLLFGQLPGEDHLELGLVGLMLAALVATFVSLIAEEGRLRRASLAGERDPLTGLPNRAGLLRRHAALPPGALAAVLMIDLNALKLVNDASGHGAGDAHIFAVARALEAALPSGAVAARWGGDEFVVLLPGETEAGARAVAERAEGRAPRPRPGVPPFAAGAALTKGGEPLERALALADERLYAAKEAQREAGPGTEERVLAGLDELSARLAALESPEEIVAVGLGLARDVLGFEAALHFERQGEEVVVVGVTGPAVWRGLTPGGPHRQPAGSGLAGRVIATGATAWAGDYGTDPDTLASAGHIKSVVLAPVRDGGVVVAMLGLASHSTWRAITPQVRRVVEAVALRLGHALERRRAVGAVRANLEGGLLALGLALEARDLETAGHTERVVRLAEALGAALGLFGADLDDLRQGAYLHDVGKLAVPDHILLKPGKLDPLEWAVMQSHAAKGSELASRLPNLSRGALDVIRHHHERWDGTGYPDGLTGPAIPLPARVFAVCDVYDALVSDRPYKRAWRELDALRELEAQAGRQFDPRVVAAFLALRRAAWAEPELELA